MSMLGLISTFPNAAIISAFNEAQKNFFYYTFSNLQIIFVIIIKKSNFYNKYILFYSISFLNMFFNNLSALYQRHHILNAFN